MEICYTNCRSSQRMCRVAYSKQRSRNRSEIKFSLLWSVKLYYSKRQTYSTNAQLVVCWLSLAIYLNRKTSTPVWTSRRSGNRNKNTEKILDRRHTPHCKGEIQVRLLSAEGAEKRNTNDGKPPTIWTRTIHETVLLYSCRPVWSYQSQRWPKQVRHILRYLVYMSERQSCLHRRCNGLLDSRYFTRTEKTLLHPGLSTQSVE